MTGGDAIPLSATELKEQIQSERLGVPFVVYRDADGRQQIHSLAASAAQRIVGRGNGADIVLDWDIEVSTVHAELTQLGGHWAISDDGLSRNGTFLNGERVLGRVVLHDRDSLRFGQTVAIFRQPHITPAAKTGVSSDEQGGRPSLSETQRRVLVSLCRPCQEPTGFPVPASNQQIADELFLSVAAVKTHLRMLFGKFGIDELPQNRKRLRLVELALARGVVSPREL